MLFLVSFWCILLLLLLLCKVDDEVVFGVGLRLLDDVRVMGITSFISEEVSDSPPSSLYLAFLFINACCSCSVDGVIGLCCGCGC